LLTKDTRERNNPIVNFFNRIVMSGLKFTMANKKIALLVAFTIMGISLFSFKFLGSEFLPELNEGALWVEAKLPMSSSLTETVNFVTQFRRIINGFDEVDGVLSQTGRSNDGTDPSGFYYVQMQVNLRPKKEWARSLGVDELVEEMDKELKKYQGIIYNYSQPIIDNVAESVAGINASNAVKIFGNDFDQLVGLANPVIK